MKIGLISDTHGWIHPRLFEHFKDCDEIWHAGDIGNIETADIISRFKTLRAVYGNVDGTHVREVCGKYLFFKAEDVNILITHIGGTPGHYDRTAIPLLKEMHPDIFICGHSHIARIIYDKKEEFLYLNPGASGYIGFHKFMTAIRFQISGTRIHDMELIELGERGKVVID